MPPDPLRHARDGRFAGPCYWTDWITEQRVETTSIRPTARRRLVEALEQRSDLRTVKLRAAGAGHSTSPVARPRPDGLLVQLEQLRLDFPNMAARWWKPDADLRTAGILDAGEHLWRTSAGFSIRRLNDALAKDRKGLPNLGSYDHQTVAGAISTATHGSGLATGPLCDLVCSIEMVCVVHEAGQAVVRSYRIEPSAARAPTDRAAFEADAGQHGMELIQDDVIFHCAVVSMGCFGVMTAVTLKVVDAFWLDEQREIVPWRTLRTKIVQQAQTHAYYDVVIVTMPDLSGDHDCLVTVRSPRPAPAQYIPRAQLPQRDDKRKQRAKAQALEANVADTTDVAQCAVLAARIGDPLAYLIAKDTFSDEADDHPFTTPPNRWKSESYVAFRTSIGDHLMATSTEIAFDIDRTVEAIDAFLAHATRLREAHPHYHYFSPIGVRFSQPSSHLLAMQAGRTTCTVEVPVLVGTTTEDPHGPSSRDTIDHLLGTVEAELCTPALGGRPHWGQRHTMTKAKAEQMYGASAVSAWMANYDRFNVWGTFDNAFTDQMGISRS